MRIRYANGKKTLVMSKKEWMDIGATGRWLKGAGTIAIDGKWYDEDTAEEVAAPDNETQLNPSVANTKDITVEYHGATYLFEVGKIYADGAGRYIVEDIKDDGKILKVKYLDGQFQGGTREYTALSRANIIHNEVARMDLKNRMKTMGFNGNKEFFALGFLAKNAQVSVQTIPDEKKWFDALYKQLTGDDASRYLKTQHYTLSKPESKWHTELRIRFPEADNAVLSQMVFKNQTVNRARSGILEINNNDFIFSLFKMGFKLGVQNIDDVRKHVPEKYMGDFNTGVNVQ